MENEVEYEGKREVEYGVGVCLLELELLDLFFLRFFCSGYVGSRFFLWQITESSPSCRKVQLFSIQQ